MPTQIITDTEHYSTVIALAAKARRSLWIGTADIKDMYVKQGAQEKPFVGVLAELLRCGSFTPKNRAIISVTISTVIRFLPRVWRERSVRVYISKLLSSIRRHATLVAPTLRVPEWE